MTSWPADPATRGTTTVTRWPRRARSADRVSTNSGVPSPATTGKVVLRTSTRSGVTEASGMPNSIHDMSGAPDANGSGAQTGADSASAPGWKSRLAALERRLNRRSTSPTARRWLLIFSLIAFVAIAVTSYLLLPDGQTFNWWMAPIIVLVL